MPVVAEKILTYLGNVIMRDTAMKFACIRNMKSAETSKSKAATESRTLLRVE
jgi:hypothetical protein